MRRLGKDWFLLGMACAVALATLFPNVGGSGGVLHADVLANVGMGLVFLFHGVGLSPQSLRLGVSNWRLHLTVQTMTYAAFPLLWLILNPLVGRYLPGDLRLGFLYLCALPSTISSSVAMTAIAKGNVPGAIFDASFSSLLGIFLTPLIVSIGYATSGGQGLSLTDAMLDIAVLLLLPFILGQILRLFAGEWFLRHRVFVNNFDKLVILMLVFTAFCNSVKGGLWTNYGIGTLLVTTLGSATMLLIVLFASTFLVRRLGFSKEDEIAAVFCGSKKTLASGVPMAGLIFGANPALGVILLPIMFYHPIQIFVCSVLADRYARRLRNEQGAAAVPATPGSSVSQEPAGA